MYWLNIHGIHDVSIIQNICEKMNIHKLVIQDILDTTQRPKLQEFDDYLFFSIKSMLPESNDKLETEQISWMEEDLKESKDMPYKIIVVHPPPAYPDGPIKQTIYLRQLMV